MGIAPPWLRVLVGVVLLTTPACLRDELATCADGTVCATPKVCAPAGDACVDTAQIEACLGAGRADGEACELGGVGTGQCRAGVCVVAGCGDGVLDPGEACDDGNEVNDDACTNACALASCGDAVVQTGEACDEGAANGDDRACTTRCLTAVCGDALVLAGVEECDAAGDNDDEAACTSACLRNVCGDGNVFFEVELCDDGNTASADGCRADCRKAEVCGDGLLDAGEACDDSVDGFDNPTDGCEACVLTGWQAEALIGGNTLALDARINYPGGIALDGFGNLYIADLGNNRVQRVNASTGTITTVAGTGEPGFSGDGGAATSARLSNPTDVAVDGLGTLYIVDQYNNRVRRVDGMTGVITTFAGTGLQAFGGDGAAATSADLNRPHGVAVDGLGQVYIADTENHRIRRVDAAGIITTVAGSGVQGLFGDGGPALAARFNFPRTVTVGPQGRLYIGDTSNHSVRLVQLGPGTITTVAGTGSLGFSGDDGPATSAQLHNPVGLSLDGAQNLYVADSYNIRIRRVDGSSGQITTVAGSGTYGYSGDDGQALLASMAVPGGVALDALGDLTICDSNNNRIRRVDATTQVITTVVGTGVPGSSPDGGPATSSVLYFQQGISVDGDGNVYVADYGSHRIRRIAALDGALTTVAGTGTPGFLGDDDAATSAQLHHPWGVTVDAAGNVFVADTNSHRIRRVDEATGIITTVAGTWGSPAYSGDDGLAVDAQLSAPQAVAVDDAGNLFIADTGNHVVRRVDGISRIITNVAGSGAPGFAGDTGAAIDAELRSPAGVAVDSGGHVYIADRDNHRIRRVDAVTGLITTVAGNGTAGYSGDGVAASSTALHFPQGIALDGADHLYIADRDNHLIRRVDGTSGIITTVVGVGIDAFAGDGLTAPLARISRPVGVFVDSAGHLYVSESGVSFVRRVDGATGVITTIAGRVDPEGMGPLAQASLVSPRALVLAAPFSLIAGGASGTVQGVRAAGTTLEVVAGRYLRNTLATADRARYRTSEFGTVEGIAYDAAAGRIYLSESSANRLHVVTVVDPADETTWTIAVLAGDTTEPEGAPGFADGAVATSRLRTPKGLFFDETARILYVADTGNHVVRAIDLATVTGTLAGDLAVATIDTIAGTPATLGYFGDDGAATEALLHQPTAVTRCEGSGDVYVADTGNHRIRRIAVGTDVITTVLGDGVAASSGQGSPAHTFPVDAPLGLACDALGNVFVTSSTTVRLLPAGEPGIVDGSGAVQSIFGAPPRDSFPASISRCLTGIAIVDDETVQVTDSCTGLLVELWRQPLPPP